MVSLATKVSSLYFNLFVLLPGRLPLECTVPSLVDNVSNSLNTGGAVSLKLVETFSDFSVTLNCLCFK